MPNVFGMGNPLLDMSCNTNQQQLDRYGLVMGNAVLAEEKHLPLYKEIADAKDVVYVAGGATQNSIRVAQWMLGEEGTTAYTGSVGNDAYGEQLSKCLAQDGVNELYYQDSSATGTCAVLIQDSERTLCANLSAANNFKQSHLDTKEVKAALAAASFVYIGGFFFTVSQPSIMQVANYVHEAKNKTLAINLSAPFIMQVPPFWNGLNAALPYVDIVVGNETEAAAFGAAAQIEGDVEAVAQHIANMNKVNSDKPRVCVITQGSSRTIIAVGGGSTISVPVPPVDSKLIVDTNGAGDAFVGGFIAAYVSGKNLEDCARAGHYSASKIIQVSGCVCPSSPSEFSLS